MVNQDKLISIIEDRTKLDVIADRLFFSEEEIKHLIEEFDFSIFDNYKTKFRQPILMRGNIFIEARKGQQIYGYPRSIYRMWDFLFIFKDVGETNDTKPTNAK